MNLNEMAQRVHDWEQEYRPPRHRTMSERFNHLSCEVSEAWREWREKNIETTYDVNNGKPHGLGPELADVILMAMTIAHAEGIDLNVCVPEKMDELDRRLAARRAKNVCP